MPYLLKRGKRYHYKRRVPQELHTLDPREHVVIPLKTDSKTVAERKSIMVNEEIELYWRELINQTKSHDSEHFRTVTQRCSLLNLTYQSSQEIAEGPVTELVNRLRLIEPIKSEAVHVEALAGGAEPPVVSLSDALEQFFNISQNRTVNKSDNQIRKWRNPYKRTMRNLISIVGNKNLKDITRDDIITFRDWWIGRIRDNDYAVDSANKEFIGLKSIIESVNDHLRLGLDCMWLFSKITLRSKQKNIRLPFNNDWIQHHILNLDNHHELNRDATYLMFAMADTGARPNELIGLDETTIFLEDKIPFIRIKPDKMRSLKTEYSERDIPLVGCALYAFQKFPSGFAKYRGRPDSLSTLLNKHLRSKELLPSANHSLYSLRHSFQDNLNRLAVPDRYQAQLMGHKFHRPEYGQGADLKEKQQWLLKMCFTQP